MISVPTERPDADAPVPPVGTEQAAADLVATELAKQQQQQPAEQSSTAEKVGDAVETVCDVTDVIGAILSFFDD